jgi:hypothetical protein
VTSPSARRSARHPVQDLLLGAIAWTARPTLSTRRAPLPERGRATYRTAVVRLPPVDLPPLGLPARHHRYPAGTVHVTVANLDAARAPLDRAVAALGAEPLPPVRFRLAGLATSPDTVFVRCLYDGGFAALRRAVAAAFDLPPRRSPRDIPYRWTAYANVVRFDGPGSWVADRRPSGSVEAGVLEIVRTDRYLSAEATEVLARVPLTG